MQGEGLWPSVIVDPADGDARVDAQYDAWLTLAGSEYELSAVQLTDYDELVATVPAGLTPGLYHLRVEAPWGATSELRTAFTVTNTRADHLVIELDSRVVEVDEEVLLGLRVVDPDGRVVPVDLPIVLSLDSDSGAEGIRFAEEQGLSAFNELNREVGLRGSLDQGEGWVSLRSLTPEDVQLTLSVDDADSTIEDASDFIAFVPGALDRVEIELPEEPFPAVAGEPFDVVLTLRDEVGNLLTDRDASVYLRELCGGLATDGGAIDIQGGVAVAEVRVTKATSADSSCPINGLEAYGEANGSSSGFQVAPAPLEGLDVQLSVGASVTAGEPVTVLVRALDPYGNPDPSYSATVFFKDDVGGLDTSATPPLGSADCLGWVGGQLPCTLTFTHAAEFVSVTAESAPDALSGEGGPLTVVAAAPESLAASTRQSSVAAGDVLEVEALLHDRWQNPATAQGAEFFVFDGAQRVSCASPQLDQDGTYVLACAPTRADAAVSLTVSLPALGLSDSAPPVLVENGALTSVSMSAPSSATAGQAFSLSLQGYDAYGNAYEVGDRSVDLRDDAGTIDVTSVSLDGSGAWTGAVVLTGAGDSVAVTASKAGVDLGSVSVEVLADTLDHYAVDLPRPWAWIGEATTLRIGAEDAWDNLIPDHAEPVTLASDQGLFVSEQVSDFEDGVAVVSLQFDSVGLGDRVRVVDADGVAGSSTQVDVLDGDCASPPSASLLLNSAREVTACINQGSASVTADLSGSVAGGGSLIRLHLADGAGSFTRTTGASVSLSYDEAGRYAPVLVAVDDDACGDEVSGLVWVNDKGEPAGEVSVSLAHSLRTAGAGAADADTTVTVTAEDCAGDPASGVDLYARADLGELSAGLTVGAQGLSLALDSAGQGSFTWSAQNLSHDGEARVAVGVLSGAAYGAATLDVEGDSHRPEVVLVDPSGATEELLDEVVVLFTEPLASADYNNKVSLSASGGEEGLSAALSADGRALTLSLDSGLDTSTDTWTLSLSSSIRDDSGNFLSGDWSGSQAAFSSAFGAVQDEGITVSSCSVSAARVVPDGADGAGVEADSVSLTASASATPAWWWVEVFDSDGERVRSQRSSSAGSLSWDARGDDGRVVAAGTYSLQLSTLDSSDSISAPCSLEVEVVERYSAP